jgi:hypothetical protein
MGRKATKYHNQKRISKNCHSALDAESSVLVLQEIAGRARHAMTDGLIEAAISRVKRPAAK